MFDDERLTHKVIHLFLLHLMLHHLFGTVAGASGYHDAEAALLITCKHGSREYRTTTCLTA